MPPDSLPQRRAEFDSHVWNHTDDAFQQSFDTRRNLRDDEVASLTALVQAIDSGADEENLADLLRDRIRKEPDLLMLILQLTGLTRSKIITDLRVIAAAAGTNAQVPGKAALLVKRPLVWGLAGPYLAKRVFGTFQSITAYDDPEGALEALNQATWSGYIRQERAKRQGHEAEGRIATILFNLGVPFEPRAKADNPMTGDCRINGVSFDIVVPNPARPVLCVKSTVQTANIGQFGESKADLEIREAQHMLAGAFPKPTPKLVAFVDGIGFHSNIAGLHGVLEGADEFAQFRTLWKVPVIAAAGLGLKLTVALPSDHIDAHEEFLARYSVAVDVAVLDRDFRSIMGEVDLVEAGEALLRVP